MKTIIQAKKYFTGDETTPKNIPKAFHLLHPLIFADDDDSESAKKIQINATQTALEFLNSIGNDEIAITALDVTFQQREASSYTSEELDTFINTPKEDPPCLLAIREQLRRINITLEDMKESDENYLRLIENRKTLQTKLAEPILGLFDQLHLSDVYDHITMAKIFFHGEHADYPNIHFEPQFEMAINYLEEGVDNGNKNSVLELMKIYLGLKTTIVEPETSAANSLLQFKNPEKADKTYQDAYDAIDPNKPKNFSFFRELEELFPRNPNLSEDVSDRSDDEDTTDEIDRFLTTIFEATQLAENGCIDEAKKLLSNIQSIYQKLVRTDPEMAENYNHTLNLINEQEEILRSSAEHRNGFHAPINKPVITIERLVVDDSKQAFTVGQRIENGEVCQRYIDIIFGETFFSISVFNQFKEILSDMGFLNAKNIANKTGDNVFSLRIWFDVTNPIAMETYEMLCSYFNSALPEIDNKTEQGKGKEKMGSP